LSGPGAAFLIGRFLTSRIISIILTSNSSSLIIDGILGTSKEIIFLGKRESSKWLSLPSSRITQGWTYVAYQ